MHSDSNSRSHVRPGRTARRIAALAAAAVFVSVSAGARADASDVHEPGVSLAHAPVGTAPMGAAPHGVRGLAAQLVSQTLATAPGAAAKPPRIIDPVLDPLMHGILERLAISEAVARNKFSSGKPVQDTPREQALLDSAAERAAQFGLTPAQARTFFRMQIEAGKLVQTALLARWAREGRAPGEPVDLSTRLRPALDRLSTSLMRDLGRLCALPDDPSRMARIHQARERIAKAAKLEALQRAAFDEATSGLCLSAPPRIWTLSLAR
ncbi:gamma subclass chorismate mutase AroQ [Pandoraea nosoerga]|uniref:chorismate mutase n=1 Tax=Pandoraea nosoerga TaxID=2508296 RepID=A0A5E4W364_9BURK|nr:gamma subclass chorismate mutase AroQ [Pandoraea nosoerga]MBN4667728.1 gamma subclass chorismate mutase AroQ [Pandoraea nosoerga]MBN4677671.1 gamma subclass chorismate mutase AroQ [Pandoraea nosoerga]MBN4682593.1 gamma subclass chorismate mutase AroQ [Pandoraea nosoerga]MBN4745008.1 gamma subclass chorismate mutase AroQ [Pandoraea nosoerga]VVE19068.1 chorismate mutase [Pandoraea nosoerga]